MAKQSPGKRGTRSAYDKAMELLVRREHSARELRTKLECRGFPSEESSAALEDLRARNYQSDERFGEMLVRSRIQAGYGPRWIVAELRTHGIDDVSAQTLIDAIQVNWPQLAREALQRRFDLREPAGPAARRKHAAFLLRRGFDATTVQSLTRAGGMDTLADETD